MKKKMILLVTIGLMSFGLMGCGSDGKFNDILENTAGESGNASQWDSEKEEVQEELAAEKIVKQWALEVINNFDYQQQFDVDVFREDEAKILKAVIEEEPSLKIIYSNDELIVAHVIESWNDKGAMMWKLENNTWISTLDVAFGEVYSNQICSQCSGWGLEVVGTHIENGRYACAICSGTGWTSTQIYDAIVGWQTIQTGCGGCGGAGWLQGDYTVYDYDTCKKCDGEGAFAVEGELEQETEVELGTE